MVKLSVKSELNVHYFQVFELKTKCLQEAGKGDGKLTKLISCLVCCGY